MTLLEIKDQIITLLIKNERFFESDSKSIKVDDSIEAFKHELILQALKDLEESKFVRKASGIEKSIWILENPVGYQGQTLEISIQTASIISSIINRYREANNIKEQYCSVLEITEADIQNICGITMHYLNKTET